MLAERSRSHRGDVRNLGARDDLVVLPYGLFRTVDALLNRANRSQVFIVGDGYRYESKVFHLREETAEFIRALPSIERVVVVPFA